MQQHGPGSERKTLERVNSRLTDGTQRSLPARRNHHHSQINTSPAPIHRSNTTTVRATTTTTTTTKNTTTTTKTKTTQQQQQLLLPLLQLQWTAHSEVCRHVGISVTLR